MKKYLYGHDSQKNAYVIEDYPYGYLRTQKRIWVETVPKKGDRVVSQTLDPKKNIWNRPKASTFMPIRFLYLDEKGHVQNAGVSSYAGFDEVKKFVAEIGGEKKLNKDQLQRFYELSGKTLEGSDPTYTFKFDRTLKDNKVYTLDIKFDVVSAIKLKHIIGAIDDIIGNTKKGKYGTPAETFKQLIADKGLIRVFGRGGRIIVGPMLADKTYQQIKSHLKNKIRESVHEAVVDVLQYDLEPGITLYYKRPEKDQERTFMFTDKKLNNIYKRNGSPIIFPMRDIYGYPKYPGKGMYKSEKVVGKINEANNNQTSKPEGLPKGKTAFMRTEGINKNPESWRSRVAKWEKELEKMIGYETLE